jgi:type I restriction enzyme S subunit
VSSDTNTPPELPAGWENPLLAEIARINPPLDRCVLDDDVEVNFVPMRAVEGEGGGLTSPEVRSFGVVKKGYTSFLSGDVIMAKITPCMENGKTTVVPELPGSVCFGSTEFHVVRPESGISPRWIANFLLQHKVRRIAQRAMAGGVGQMRVPSTFLETIRIPLPPSDEQNRIADVVDELLSDLDDAAAAMARVRAKLLNYRASVLKAAAEGTLTAEWRHSRAHAESACELLRRILDERRNSWQADQVREFKEKEKEAPKNWKSKYREPKGPDTANLPRLPDGWSWVALDQIADIAGGVTKGQKFSLSDRTRLVAYLRVANVQRGFLDLSEIKVIRALESDIEALRLLPGDILFNEGGDRDKLGRGWIWQGQIPECIHQNHVFRARLFLREMQPRFVSWCGNSYGQLWFMKAGKQSVNLASINLTVLRSFPVPLPPLSEQDAISEAVEAQLSVIEHLEADLNVKLKSAQALRQSILRHAFTGQLVSPDPNDEAASKLLERIAAGRKMHANAASGARVRKSIDSRGAIRSRRRKNLDISN